MVKVDRKYLMEVRFEPMSFHILRLEFKPQCQLSLEKHLPGCRATEMSTQGQVSWRTQSSLLEASECPVAFAMWPQDLYPNLVSPGMAYGCSSVPICRAIALFGSLLPCHVLQSGANLFCSPHLPGTLCGFGEGGKINRKLILCPEGTGADVTAKLQGREQHLGSGVHRGCKGL